VAAAAGAIALMMIAMLLPHAIAELFVHAAASVVV
jgi:hypothetical protein